MSARAAWTRQDKVKAGVWAVGFAAVIMVGSWTGATLKQDKQKEEVSHPFPTQPAKTDVARVKQWWLMVCC
jgi:hypothetical protein